LPNRAIAALTPAAPSTSSAERPFWARSATSRPHRPGGPRYSLAQSASERQRFENLILLCGNHHKIIDDDPDSFSVERLRKMKSDHEKRSSEIGAIEIEHASRLLVERPVVSVNQSAASPRTPCIRPSTSSQPDRQPVRALSATPSSLEPASFNMKVSAGSR
jgi:hypothetical protein